MAEIEIIEQLVIVYLSTAVVLLAIALARPRFRRLKLLHGFKYQMVVFLALWTAGEIADSAFGVSGIQVSLKEVHFSAMVLFAAFVTFSLTRLIGQVRKM